MRVDVDKYLLMGPTSSKSAFFKAAQQAGVIEFIAHAPPSLETPQEIQNFIDALHVLRQMVPVKQTSTHDYHSSHVLARHVVERARELERLKERARLLEIECARIEVFGDFSIDTLQEVERASRRTLQFFFAKKPEELLAPQNPEVLFIGRANELSYFVAINEERKSYDGFIEIMIERSLGDVKYELAEVYRQIDEFETELATLAHHKKQLHQGLIDTLNRYHLLEAKERANSLLDGEVFAVEAWVPKNKLKELKALGDQNMVHVEQVVIEKKDRVPTYLENSGLPRLGEDLVSIYDTPSKEDKDPSAWVFFSFGIFFSMIIADAGYGLLLLGMSLYLFYKFGKQGGLVRRVTLLASSLSIGCVVWGILLSSFFGISLAPDNPIRKASVINWMVEKKASYLLEKKSESYEELVKEHPQLKLAKTAEELLMGVVKKTEHGKKYVIYDTFQDNVLIELALFIGTIHIILSFMRYLRRTWSGLGWVVFLVGGYLYFPLVLKAISLIHYVFGVPYAAGGSLGFYLIFIGLGLAWVLAVIQHGFKGLEEIMNVIQVFADVMSYLRIYALSLAGMIMASTFNQIGTSMPFYIGIFILLAGHTINFTLALMGGVIHGLRLNFIEWYHYSFEGGGRHFLPLKLQKI